MAKKGKNAATTEEIVAALCEDVRDMSVSPQNLRINQLGKEPEVALEAAQEEGE